MVGPRSLGAPVVERNIFPVALRDIPHHLEGFPMMHLRFPLRAAWRTIAVGAVIAVAGCGDTGAVVYEGARSKPGASLVNR